VSADCAGSDARTHDSVRKRSFSEASTVISPDALPDMSSISLSDNSSTNNTSPALAAGEVRTNPSSCSNFPAITSSA
jgi:hypothetical protein